MSYQCPSCAENWPHSIAVDRLPWSLIECPFCKSFFKYDRVQWAKLALPIALVVLVAAPIFFEYGPQYLDQIWLAVGSAVICISALLATFSALNTIYYKLRFIQLS
jgi:hypothetical protein